jgi:ubiquinone/menaquinone biosynthesis C-methylase UbiE
VPLDPYAEQGFRTDADQYDRHRPEWPDAAIDRVMEHLGTGPEGVVLDLAAGTGKLTRRLLPRVSRVIAVEPLDGMRRLLEESVPEAEALPGTADAIPLADGTVDAVFVAEAFHWFATGEAVAEIARVLRPGGGLAIMWNIHQFGDEPWTATVGEVFGEFLPRAGDAARRDRREHWEDAFDGAPFEPLEYFGVPNEQHTDLDGFIAHVRTWSHTRALDDATREEFVARLREALERSHPTPDTVVIPYETAVYWTRRR